MIAKALSPLVTILDLVQPIKSCFMTWGYQMAYMELRALQCDSEQDY